MMKGWPSAWCSAGAIVRAAMSGIDPEGNEAMTRTGFAG